MLLAAYATPNLDQPLELSDAFRVTRNESRREDYVRIAGREDLTAGDILSLRHAVQIDLAHRVRPPVLLKTHNARCVVGGVPIIRDDITQHLRSWSLHVTGWTEHAAFPVHVIRYEELLASTATTLRNVLTFLGWPADRRRIDHAVEQTQINRLADREAAGGFAERSQKSVGGRFFRHGRSGRWQSILTGPQIATVRQHHGAAMRRLGY